MRCRFSVLAKRDLQSILRFVGQDSLARAEALVDRIEVQAQKVANHPLAYRARLDLGEHVRVCPFERYLILYRTQDDETILVLRVLHSAMDIGGQLEADP